MCELLGMSSNLPATLSLSLRKLAAHGGFSGPHTDGWGIGYYEGEDVRLIKGTEAAADSEWVRFVEEHDVRSRIVIAHIRKATMGARSYRNTQPFARELAGRMHLFAHNGYLPGIDALPTFKLERFHPVGETDSEIACCALLDRMTHVWTRPAAVPPLEERLRIVSAFAADVRALGPANFLYSDGDVLFAHGHMRKRDASSTLEPPGLVCLQRRCRKGERGFAASGLSIAAADQIITLLASVPLTDDPWQPVGEGEVIAISNGQRIASQPAERKAADSGGSAAITRMKLKDVKPSPSSDTIPGGRVA
jgi:predicted glutamine amidotransferase